MWNPGCLLSLSVAFESLRPCRPEPTRLLCPWDFPGREYWSGLPLPLPRDLLFPGIEPASLASPALAGEFFTTVPPGKPGIQYSPNDYVSAVIFFKLEDNCFTMLCWFLPYNNVSQPSVYLCPLPLESPSYAPDIFFFRSQSCVLKIFKCYPFHNLLLNPPVSPPPAIPLTIHGDLFFGTCQSCTVRLVVLLSLRGLTCLPSLPSWSFDQTKN